jgi:hypothetical protein
VRLPEEEMLAELSERMLGESVADSRDEPGSTGLGSCTGVLEKDSAAMSGHRRSQICSIGASGGVCTARSIKGRVSDCWYVCVATEICSGEVLVAWIVGRSRSTDAASTTEVGNRGGNTSVWVPVEVDVHFAASGRGVSADGVAKFMN